MMVAGKEHEIKPLADLYAKRPDTLSALFCTRLTVSAYAQEMGRLGSKVIAQEHHKLIAELEKRQETAIPIYELVGVVPGVTQFDSPLTRQLPL